MVSDYRHDKICSYFRNCTVADNISDAYGRGIGFQPGMQTLALDSSPGGAALTPDFFAHITLIWKKINHVFSAGEN